MENHGHLLEESLWLNTEWPSKNSIMYLTKTFETDYMLEDNSYLHGTRRKQSEPLRARSKSQLAGLE